jgi:UDP-glucose 4-epimerase
MSTLKGKILITGGAGFIGTHLAERFCEKYEIVLLDNLRRDSLSDFPKIKNHPNVKFIEGTITDKKLVLDAIKGCHTAIHLAAIAGVSSYYDQPFDTMSVNLLGTINLLECVKEEGVGKVIDFSTSEIYGSNAFDVDESSDHVLGSIEDYRWTYATSKLASEQLTRRYSEKYGFKGFGIRPFNIYGPRQTGEGAISNFMTAVVKKEPIIIYNDGTAIRAWCYITDMVDALENLLENDNLESGSFNVGNPKEVYSTAGLARLVCTALGVEVPIIYKEVPRTEIRIRIPNIDKAKKFLNYNPKVGLIEGLRLTYEWYKETLKP